MRSVFCIIASISAFILCFLIPCCRNDPGTSNDNILSDEEVHSPRRVPFSGMLQAAIKINTRIFHGQGVSAAIITDDNRYWTGTGGYSEPGEPVNADMMFNIGSIGKNFLAVLILQLVEEGKLALDDPLTKWGLGTPTIDENITIRQLLNHTSGIFDWVKHPQSPYILPYSQLEYERIWSQQEIIDRLAGDPYFESGMGWNYSTTNYNLLKIIAEKTTGTTVASEIMKRFLKPLGLEHTVAVDTYTAAPPQPEIAHGWFDKNGDGRTEDISVDSQNWIVSMSPNMMYASALDLAVWSQALYEGRVLGRSSLYKMLNIHHPAPGEPPLTGYGLGTAEISLIGLIKLYGHLGLHYGNMSAMIYIPSLRTSLVVLTNGNNQLYQYVVFLDLLAAIVLAHLRFLVYAAVVILISFISWAIFRRL